MVCVCVCVFIDKTGLKALKENCVCVFKLLGGKRGRKVITLVKQTKKELCVRSSCVCVYSSVLARQENTHLRTESCS